MLRHPKISVGCVWVIRALYYNNIEEKAIYGVLEISKQSYADLTANDSKWMAVDAMPTQTFDPPIQLGTPEVQR